MGHKMNRSIFIPFGLLVLALPTVANASSAGAGPGFFWSSDNEDFTVRRYELYALPDYHSGNSYTGLKAVYHDYEQDGWSRHGEQASVVSRHGAPGDVSNWDVDAGVFKQGDHELLTFEGNYSRALLERTRVEFFGSRDWVETAPALDQGIHFDFAGASLEQGVSDHVTLIGTAAGQWFSDGNRRTHLRFRFNYQPMLDSGVTLQLRYRHFNSSKDDVGGAYFNPSEYWQTLAGPGWRKRWQGWNFGVMAGAGRQKVDSMHTEPAYLLELSLENPDSAGMAFKVRGGYQKSEGFTGPGYRYHYLQAMWLIPI